jgi:hypothetical protein
MFVNGPFARTGGIWNANGGTVFLSSPTSQTLTPGGALFNHVTINDGLAAYWKLDDAASPALDSSGNGLSGVHAGGPTVSAVAAPLTFNNPRSVQFDGVDDRIEVADPGAGSPLTFTIGSTITTALWIRPNALAPSIEPSWRRATAAPPTSIITGSERTEATPLPNP